MIIGIDVGGTHADGVLLNGKRVVAKKKVSVDQSRLSESIIDLLRSLLPENLDHLDRIHLSTTLCTNALVNNNLDEVGMLIQSGPGMNPAFLECGDNLHFLSGAIDHRGEVVRGPNRKELNDAVETLKEKNITSIGIVTKFSHRNNEHELWLADQVKDSFDHVSMGHRLSGMPNFPRRVYSTWLNSGLKSRFNSFKQAIEDGFRELGITCPCYILKADGGTIPFSFGSEQPCQSIHSGPSASIMGALALDPEMGDSILLDIGGTTTDIALFVDGIPLLEPYGATVEGRPTLIRALLSKSIGLGGDSMVSFQDNSFTIGPEKKGAPMAFGGSLPTPTDAMVVLGGISEGDKERAKQAMQILCPGVDAAVTASKLLECFTGRVFAAVQKMIEEVFQRPVYTVSAFLERHKLNPDRLTIIGGPAHAMEPFLEKQFQLKTVVPQDFEVANAIGAGRARLTVSASLYCDTGAGRLSIPEISCMERPGRMFTMIEAEAHLEEAIKSMVHSMGATEIAEIDFIERMEMNTVKGFSSTGKILTLKAQIRPGLARIEG